jgi:hypothetical protein
MIPDTYWQLLRRWFWLILLFVVAGAAAGFSLLPIGLGQSSSYSSSVTLGLARFVSFSGTVSAGSASDEGALLGEYTFSIAELAKTPQFQARLKDALADEGVVVTEPELARRVKVVPDKALFRVTVLATSSSAEKADLLSRTATDALKAQVAAEEQRIIESLNVTMEQQRTELLNRLATLSEERRAALETLDAEAVRQALDELIRTGAIATSTADLGPRFKDILLNLALITGDPQLAVVNSETAALEGELGDVSKAQESFAIDLLRWGQPLFVLNPSDTVLTEPERALRKRDMLVLGAAGGLILGWMTANAAEHVRNGRKPEHPEREPVKH